MQKAATGAFAAFTIASSVIMTPPVAQASIPAAFGTQVLAEKVVREGIYGEFEYDMPEQKYDDARSTFKSAKETKSKKGELNTVYFKMRWQSCVFVWSFSFIGDGANHSVWSCTKTNFSGKYTALLAVLIVGSFIIPMAQYFWYVRANLEPSLLRQGCPRSSQEEGMVLN